MSKWMNRESQGYDPLVGYQNKPIISSGQGNQRYLGRVIVELWEDGSSHDDSYKIAYSARAIDGYNEKLVQRVAAALPVRIQHNSSFKPAPESVTATATSPQSWISKVSSADDPLVGYQNKPIISSGQGNQQYLGRVIVEIWENDSAHDDSYKIAFLADAIDGNNEKLLQRVAAALPTRLQRNPPFPPSMM